MRIHTLTASLFCVLLAGSAQAQTTPPAVDPGPAIAGNSDPAMGAKHKMPMKKKKMSKKMMMKKKM